MKPTLSKSDQIIYNKIYNIESTKKTRSPGLEFLCDF